MGIEEVIVGSPRLYLFIIAAMITLISTLVHKKMTNQDQLRNLKKRQKEIQREIRKHTKKGDTKKAMDLQAEGAKLALSMFKFSMKPLFVTMIPLLLLFFWLRGVMAPVLSSWIWYYIGFSVVTSMTFRKVFNVA